MPAKRAPIPRQARIDLAGVVSAMDRHARASAEARAARARAAASGAPDGKVWCGPCAAHVPPEFGRGCIAASCPLRPAAGQSGRAAA